MPSFRASPTEFFAHAALCVAVLLAPRAAKAQETVADSGVFSRAGAALAGAAVNEVYIDRVATEATVEGGAFASHLLERLGVRPVPDGLALEIATDTGAVTIRGRVADLPDEVRAMLGGSLALLPPDAVVSGNVRLGAAGPRVVRFRLTAIAVDGVPVPEMLVAAMMAEVGRQVPALTRTGRDLLVAIPAGARLELIRDGVRLVGPPPDSASAHDTAGAASDHSGRR